ncbi:MAG: M6 family metalloprotease domain-containing protein [Fibrobacter sp.]|nr:M6 family metalloprotease domain-containing protein [Fibrobacter sp.]
MQRKRRQELRGGTLRTNRGARFLEKKESIDYSKYDNDGDGEIDFTYMFYAGVGANNSGVVGAIWPHAWYIGNSVNKRSGKNMGNDIYANRYACSNEIDGYAYKKDNSTDILGGIGTFAHEFSHVLGLPDMYDLKGNNPRKTPKKWDVMDNGNYNCPYNSYGTQNCAPPFYSAFERMSLGWMNPTELYAVGQVKLDKIDGNNAYSITNPNNPDEMFLLEYRTQKDWDVGQPNSGMLIWHIDYVASVWKEKTINNNGDHMYVDIEEASPEIDKYARPYDVFPGTKVVTEFSDFRFWSGARAEVHIYGISESEDKTYALFNVEMEISSSSEESSSSEGESSSSMIQSSSSEDASSSSMTPSSSSERFVQYARRGHTACDVSLDHRNNVVLVQLPKAGKNRVRLFSLNGNLVYDKFFEGNFVKAALPATLGKQSFVILVEQNGMLLTTRQIR